MLNHLSSHRQFRLAFISACAVLTPVGAANAQTASSPAATVVHVTIDPSVTLAKITPLSFGINTAIYDSHLPDPVIPSLVKGAGFTMMRYPGGSSSDEYHWQTNTNTPQTPDGAPGQDNSATDFDHFMQIASACGVQPIITINYGSNPTRTGGGTPEEAAAWVAYAKKKNYHVKYWEIGNEIYGNGFYGTGWETDLNAPMKPGGAGDPSRKNNPALSPTAYGKNVLAFARAMKAQDRSAQIGVVLAAPLSFPDGGHSRLEHRCP